MFIFRKLEKPTKNPTKFKEEAFATSKLFLQYQY
jgi:hypothetical protein